jgi:hypothetical protein
LYPEEDNVFNDYMINMHLLDKEQVEEEVEEDEMRATVTAALLLISAEVDCKACLECRHSH